MSEAMNDTKTSAVGRGTAQPMAPERHGDLIRALVERTAAGAPPSVRRRAIVLASVRIAQTNSGDGRGKA